MVLGWLTTAAMLVPFLDPYVKGEKPFDVSAALALFAVVIAHLNHSPTPTRGGGLPPPTVTLLLLVACAACVGCGTWRDTGRATIAGGATAVNVADGVLAVEMHRTCDPAVAAYAPGTPERAAAGAACLTGHHYVAATDAITAADHALRVAQAILDDDTATLAAWLGRVACLLATVRDVFDALTAAGVAVPPDTRATVDGLLAVAAGACNDTIGDTP
jgi:hypothetical protein